MMNSSKFFLPVGLINFLGKPVIVETCFAFTLTRSFSDRVLISAISLKYLQIFWRSLLLRLAQSSRLAIVRSLTKGTKSAFEIISLD